MKQKVYTVVKYEIINGADAMQVIVTTLDKEIAVKHFIDAVKKDKKKNPLWSKTNPENNKIYDDFDDCYCVWDMQNYAENHTIIILDERDLK